MKIIYGDLIKMAKNGKFNVIIHQANCFNTMGDGIAARIKEEFPAAYEADKHYLFRQGLERLGRYSVALCNPGSLFVVNLYSQLYPGKNTDYNVLRSALKNFNSIWLWNEYKIGIPALGCGIGGGNLSVVTQMVAEELYDLDVTMVLYKE